MRISKDWYSFEECHTDKYGSIVRLKIHKNWALWKMLWDEALAVYTGPKYLLPLVVLAVTKCWIKM